MRKQLFLMFAFLLYVVGMAAQPDWGYKPNAYESEHVVYVGLEDTNGAVGEYGSYVGAFIDGECRGLAQQTVSNNVIYYPLRVKGSSADNGKTITFRHCTRSGVEFDLTPTQALVYADNATTGSLSALYKLPFVKPDSYKILQPNVTVNVGESVDLMQYIEFYPDGANVPANPNWDFANNQSYFVVENNKLVGKAPVTGGYLGFAADEMKPVDDVSSFSVTVTGGLSGFQVDNMLAGLGTYAQVNITPDPADAKYDPALINVTVDWNPQYTNELSGWSIADISANGDGRLGWTLVPKALGHGIISVYYDSELKGQAELTVGQNYTQKSGWVWSTFYGDIDGTAMQQLFGNAVEEMRSEDKLMYNDPQYGYFGTLTMLSPLTAYKVKIGEHPGYVDFNAEAGGYSAAEHTKEYHEGWNWMAYNNQLSLSPDEYFSSAFTDGDRIVSKDEGFAEYTAGKWVGTLTTMRFGQGYMFYNADAAAKRVTAKGDGSFSQPDGSRSALKAPARASVWTYNSAPFADNMTVIADFGAQYAAGRYSVGAFVGGECRGEGRMVDGKFFITVHADKGETVSFLMHDDMTGQTRAVNEQMAFASMAGSLAHPVSLTLGGTTAIDQAAIDRSGIAVVDGQLSVRGLDVASIAIVNTAGTVVMRNQTNIGSLPSGVYVVNVKTKDGRTITKKIAI